MGDSSENSGRQRSGVITERDKEWLEGKKSGKNQKHLMRKGMSQLMQDLEYLLQIDPEDVSDPQLEGLGEFFTRVESDTGIPPEECARSLIALAFIISNEPINYDRIAEEVNLHPREENKGEMPGNDERPTRGAPLDFDQPVGDLLTFRRSLSAGIKIGKEHVARNDEDGLDSIPDIILIDSNTRLYKEPTYHRIDPDSEAGFTSEDWRDVLANALDADLPEYKKEDLTKITRTKAVREMQTVINANVGVRLGLRRIRSDRDIIRHDTIPGTYADPPYEGTISILERNKHPDSSIGLEVDMRSTTLSNETIPELELNIWNNTDEPVSINEDSDDTLNRRCSDPKGLVLLTEEEFEETDIKYTDCAVVDSASSIKISPVQVEDIAPGEKRTTSFFIIGISEEFEGNHPSNGKYRFRLTCSSDVDSGSEDEYEESTREFGLELDS